jgi:outer membrane protein assembly factor BamB
MNISKLLTFLLIAVIISGCDKSKNTVKNIIDFTPKLRKEADLPHISLDNAIEVDQWGGGDFVNKLPSNFAIKDWDGLFAKSGMTLAGNIAAAPIIKNDLLFVLDSKNNVTCYDLKQQKMLWQRNLNLAPGSLEVFLGGITLFDNKLYVANNSRELIVLEADTGYQLSSAKLNDVLFNPAAVDDKGIYLLTASNQIVTLRKNNLSVLWSANGAQSSLSLSQQNLAQPIVLDDGILIALYSGQVIYSNKHNGHPHWQVFLSGQHAELSDLSYANLSSQMIIDNKSAFVPSSLGLLTKINIDNAQEVWRKNIADILAINKFSDLIVVTTNAQEIAGISSSTGQIFWVINLAQGQKEYKNPYNLLTPLMINGDIYVLSSKGQLYKIGVDGKLLAQHKIPREVKFYAINKQDIYLFSKRSIWKSKRLDIK